MGERPTDAAGIHAGGIREATGGNPGLTISPVHAAVIDHAAAMLEISPQQLLNWILSDYTNDLADAESGIMQSWTTGIIYPPDVSARVKANVRKWERQQLGTNLN